MFEEFMKILFFYESIGLGGQQTQTLQLIRRLGKGGRDHSVKWAYLRGHELIEQVEAYGETHQIVPDLSSRDYIKRPWRVASISTTGDHRA